MTNTYQPSSSSWEERFKKLPQGMPLNRWDNYITVANAKSFITSELEISRREAITEVKEIIKEYGEFCKTSHEEAVENSWIMLAYDFDSRQVAVRHILDKLDPE